ncbi:MAG: hypothetical protein ABJK37_16365 [Paraglaciecola sp.]|uniref:hypothetical protein n=1 Tax=Paraglaciecola sp. TaxID=1920173 RepID=UPI003297E36F
MKNKVLLVTSLLSLCIVACSKQAQVKTEFFIQQDNVSGYNLSELVESLDSLPNQINGCDAIRHENELLLQCSKKGYNYTNKQVLNSLSDAPAFSSKEEFGQYNFKWKSGTASCSIAIDEINDIFELWCSKIT